MQQLLNAGLIWIVDADVKGYFDNIPQDKLLALMAEYISDGAVLELLRRALKQGVMESAKGWQPTETGTPQGAVISPLLANIYLNPLDHLMAQQGWEMVRYADDFIILCASAEQAQAALATVRQWMEQAGLTLHPTLKDALRAKSKRQRPDSVEDIIEDVNRSLRGWMNYFQHSHWTTFKPLDQWIRQRLRSILRKRHKLSGRARGRDHQRWPNDYFAIRGLISLALARVKAANAIQAH